MNRKFIVYIVAFAAFLGPFTQTIYTPVLPEVTRQLHSTSFVVNLTISVFTLFLAIMQMIYGPLTDSKGRRKVLLFGISLYVIASVGCFFSGNIELLLVFRALQAIGIAAGSVVAVTVISDLFDGKERGQAMGTFQMLVSLGPVLGPVIGGFLSGIFHFHAVFLALAATGLVVLVFNYLYLKETKPDHVQAGRFRLRDFAAILQNRTGSSIIYLGFIQYYVFYDFLVFLPNILSDRYGLSAEQKGLVFLPMSLGIVVGSYAGGKLQARINGKKLVVLTTFLNAAAVLFFLIFYSMSLPLLLAGIIFFGLFLGLSLPVQTTLLTGAFTNNRATAVGAYNFFRYMGMACSPIIGSPLYHLGGNILLFGFILVVFAAFALLLSRRLLGSQAHRPTPAEG
ncbi:MFS transporter [Paenibacillus sacheonensis]|uniref:MFS transporter n=1 Tax=Paenibacillus sacheonensis TaxID=742054 RepID=A0A7X4YQ56_9BACL|nr:MFS transporter [Paenibacillus sacheonensis]MBM7566284.1 multidrug resistance protein [Paenibacillus sacheonensis]NBC70490.1 MFS transporter [Paenibacillus sacheonensis]